MNPHKFHYFRGLLLICLLAAQNAFAQQSDSLRTTSKPTILVLDSETRQPIQDALLSYAQTTITADSTGIIRLPSVPRRQEILKISALGYTTQALHWQDLTLSGGQRIVALRPYANNLREAVVRGTKNEVSVNAVASQINSRTISSAMGQSLASLLEKVGGVSSIQTGTSTAKPVIQGMYGNRILMINNGARQTGQQWGLDHAPEIDKNSSARIQVVKGAEAVRYGSEALGGIIILEQKPLPYGETNIGGSVSGLVGANGLRYNAVATIEGSMPFLRDLAWRVQGTYLNSGDARTADYVLNNTGYREQDVSLNLGYRHGPLRLETSYSLFDHKEGVMMSSQLGSEDLLRERIEAGRPTYILPFSRHILYPYHRVVHHTAIGKAFLDGGKWGQFFWQTAFQNDIRKEFRVRRMNLSHIPAVSMTLTSFQNQLKWTKDYANWQSEAGISYLHIRNKNEAGTGVVSLIPNYTEYDAGAFLIQKYRKGIWSGEAGVRFDHQQTRAAGYDYTGKLYTGDHKFSNLSYNLGFHVQPSNAFSLTSNLGLAWRAPHVHELYSNGNELGSGMFVVGDANMKSEQSTKWIVSADYQSKLFGLKAEAFVQWINGYIYDEPTHQFITVISGSYPLFQYKQTDAFFRGFDAAFDLRPLKFLHYHLQTSLIWANERKTRAYLPYIPSWRVDQEVGLSDIKWGKTSPWISLRHRFVAKQRRFNPASDLVNFTPPAYHLFGVEAGAEWALGGRQKLRLSLTVDNLFNKLYKEYTNRSRYYAHDMGRDVRLQVNWLF